MKHNIMYFEFVVNYYIIIIELTSFGHDHVVSIEFRMFNSQRPPRAQEIIEKGKYSNNCVSHQATVTVLYM